ncbi:class F sortase [Sporichthya sp.]|uniref:class F sortase n=1 Tax=Sporichthya sp. TaxID=65475 RepID=UPI00182CAE7F|nr:class F sortase [Sporichthya sp.]MBA3743875.1 class F sortase [Sporichthya sp.]
MIRRNQNGGLLAKRSTSDQSDDYDLFADHDEVSDEMAPIADSTTDSSTGNADELEDAPRSRSFTKLQFALAALSATPVLFIGGLGGWPWDNEPAAANNTVVAGHEHYPASVQLARLGISTELDALNLNPATNILEVPALGRAGWIESGAEPGVLGRAVILGRRSQSGEDVFAKLVKARAGDKIVVTTLEGKTLNFVVQSVEQFQAGEVPETRVYGGGKQQAQLRLITSTGTYNQAKGGFPRNVVVFADLAK